MLHLLTPKLYLTLDQWSERREFSSLHDTMPSPSFAFHSISLQPSGVFFFIASFLNIFFYNLIRFLLLCHLQTRPFQPIILRIYVFFSPRTFFRRSFYLFFLPLLILFILRLYNATSIIFLRVLYFFTG